MLKLFHYVQLAVVTGILLLPSHAWGFCASRAELIDLFGEKYQEGTKAAGIASDGSLLEVLVSPKGATWTIIFTKPGGESCAVITGRDWRALDKPAPEPKA